MKSPRNQLILLGFICQSLSWDDYVLPFLSVVLWLICVNWRGRPIRMAPWMEAALLVGGCVAALVIGRALGRNTHFFIGHGLVLIQALRMLRPLNQREKVFSILIACFHLGVGCTFLFDLRFILVLVAAVYLLPRVFAEIQVEAFATTTSPVPASTARLRMGGAAYIGIVAAMVIFFLVFPRGFLGSPLQNRSAIGNEGSLLDSVLDPSRSALAQSTRVLFQIEGERLGYLRCFSLIDFDGERWFPIKRAPLKPLWQLPLGQLTSHLHRRVRVKNAAVLARVLPTDGHVDRVTGRFFGRAFRNSHGGIEADTMWNTSNNRYEYWTNPTPPIEQLFVSQLRRYTAFPPQSERLRQWLAQRVTSVTEPLAQARLLESWLQDNCTYELGAPELNRLNPTDDFVFEQRRGHCERFASTLTLLLRMQGIPSRVVIGYVPSARNPFSGAYNIRYKDAHAWTEGWFKEVGWVEFDATPRAVSESVTWNFRDVLDDIDFAFSSYVVNFDAPTQSYLFSTSIQTVKQFGAWTSHNSGWLVPVLAGPLLILLLRELRRRQRKRPEDAAEESAAVVAAHYYGEMLDVLGAVGWLKRAPETPIEFLGRIRPAAATVVSEVDLVTSAFCASRYGNRPLSAEDEARIESAVAAIRRGLGGHAENESGRV